MKEQDIPIKYEHYFSDARYQDLGPYVPKLYETVEFSDSYLPRETQEKIIEWVKHCDSFIVYLGKGGCGKTHFSISLAKYIFNTKVLRREVLVNKQKKIFNDKGTLLSTEELEDEIDYKRIDIKHPSVLYYPITKFYEEFKKLYSQDQGDDKLKKQFSEIDYLILDDVGAMRNNEWQVQTFYEIIDSRWSNMKPTIITSNLDFTEIKNAFHDRVRSRLEDERNLVIYDWDHDYRSCRL